MCMPAPNSPLGDKYGPRSLCFLAAFITLFWLSVAVLNAPDVTGGSRLPFADGASFYCAGQAAAQGHSPYGLGFIESCFTRTYFIHPPVSLLLFDVWARLPLKLAMALSYAAQGWALGVLMLGLWQRFVAGQWSLYKRYAFVGLLGLADCIHFNLLVGQVNLMALGLAVWAVNQLEQKQPLKAGLALLGASLMKPYFLPLGLLLLPRAHWRGLLAALLGGLLLCALSGVLYGPALWRDFFDFHQRYLSAASGIFFHQPWAMATNASPLAAAERMGFAYAQALPVWRAFVLLLALACAGLLLRLWQKQKTAAAWPAFAIILCGVYLALPIAWTVYLPWLLPAALWAGRAPAQQLGLMLLVLLPWGNFAQEYGAGLLYGPPAVALLLLVLCGLKAVRTT